MERHQVKGWHAHPNLWKTFAGAAILASFLLPLALYCVVGLYTRYAADDYETAGSLNKYGFWGSQRFWYLNWSGRYAYFMIVNLFEMIGVRAAPALTALCLLLWLAAISWLIYHLLNRDGVRHPVYLSVLLGALTLLVTLRSMAHIHQILFWVTGILTYTTYLILLTFFLGWMIYRWNGVWRFTALEILAASAFVFMLTGISEVSASLQLLMAGLWVLFAILITKEPSKRKNNIVLSIALLSSTMAGFAILLMSPGNTVRAALGAPRPDLWPLVVNANVHTVLFIANWLKDHTFLAGMGFFLPAISALLFFQPPSEMGSNSRRDATLLRGMWLSPILVYLALLSAFATGYYALSANLPDRAQLVPTYILTLAVMLWGYWSGSLLKSIVMPGQTIPKPLILVGTALVVLMLLFGPLYASANIYTMIEPARARAIEWDERDGIIQQAIQEGERNVVVWYIRDLNRLGDYSSDPEFLVNRAAADYYGLDSIIALDERVK